MNDLEMEPRPRRRRWPWIVLAAVAALVLAAFGLWRAFGTEFVYRQIQPQEAALLAGHEVPDAPSAEDLVADLRFLAEELPRRHADFADAFDREAFGALIARLEAAAPGMTPEQRQMAVLEVVASGGPGTGHTLVVPLQRALDWRHYGLAFWDFADGLYVVHTAARLAPLAGAKVLAVGGVAAAEALARLAPYTAADNAWSRRLRTPQLLGMAEPLMAVGLADAGGRATFTLDSGDGPRDVVLEPFRIPSIEGLGWGLRIQEGIEGAWSPADLRPREPSYRVGEGAAGVDEPVEGVVVVRVETVREGPGGSLARFVREAVRAAGSRPPESPLRRFVVDLRSNGGGNNQLAPGVVDAIAGDPVVDRRGVLYVLIGRRTFSAAGNLAVALERRTRATFVGEPSGSAPTQWGDNVPMLLPGTKIVARLATRLWLDDLPGVRRTTLEPDVEVPIASHDHFADTDPAIAAVLAHRVEERPAPGGAAGELPDGWEGAWLATPLHRVTIRAAGAPARDETGGGAADERGESGEGDEGSEGSESSEEDGVGDSADRGAGGAAGGESAGVSGGEVSSRAGAGDGVKAIGDGVAAPIPPRLEISTGEPFAETDLHPLGGGRWGTDVRDVELVAAAAGGAPVLRWKGRDFPLRRAPEDHRLPLELLGDDDADPAVEAAVAAFRAAAREVEIDSDVEMAINAAGYDLLRNDRAAGAVALFRLNTELFPASPNTWDSFGDGLRGIDDLDAARAAYRRALEIDPTFEHSRRRLAELDRQSR